MVMARIGKLLRGRGNRYKVHHRNKVLSRDGFQRLVVMDGTISARGMAGKFEGIT